MSAAENDEVVGIRDDVRTERFPASGQPPVTLLLPPPKRYMNRFLKLRPLIQYQSTPIFP